MKVKGNHLFKQQISNLYERRYYQHHPHKFADHQIEIDLDDGIVKAYVTFAPTGLTQIKKI